MQSAPTGSTVTLVSVAPAGKPGCYGIRYFDPSPRTLDRYVGDALYSSTTDSVEILSHQPASANPGLANLVRDAVALLMNGTEPRRFAFMKIDVVDHSRISMMNQQRETDATWDNLHAKVVAAVEDHKGEMWGWQGDGGLCAFGGEGREERAVACARQLLRTLPEFNEDSTNGNRVLGETIRLRVAVHSGWAKERLSRGEIHSRDINFVAHLEAQRTLPDTISISDEAYRDLSREMQTGFSEFSEPFEARRFYTSGDPVQLQEYIATRRNTEEELLRQVIELRREVTMLKQRGEATAERRLLQHIVAEVSENIRVIETDREGTVPLGSTAWDQYRGDIGSLLGATQEALEDTYVAIRKINQLARQYEAGDSSSLRGQFRTQMAKAKQDLKPLLLIARDMLVPMTE